MCRPPDAANIMTGKEHEKFWCVCRQVEIRNNQEVDKKKKKEERKQEKGHADEVITDKPEGLSRLTWARLLLPSGLFFLSLGETLAWIHRRTPTLVWGTKEREQCPAGQEGCTEQSYQCRDAWRAEGERQSMAHYALPAGLRYQVSSTLFHICQQPPAVTILMKRTPGLNACVCSLIPPARAWLITRSSPGSVGSCGTWTGLWNRTAPWSSCALIMRMLRQWVCHHWKDDLLLCSS